MAPRRGPTGQTRALILNSLPTNWSGLKEAIKISEPALFYHTDRLTKEGLIAKELGAYRITREGKVWLEGFQKSHKLNEQMKSFEPGRKPGFDELVKEVKSASRRAGISPLRLAIALAIQELKPNDLPDLSPFIEAGRSYRVEHDKMAKRFKGKKRTDSALEDLKRKLKDQAFTI